MAGRLDPRHRRTPPGPRVDPAGDGRPASPGNRAGNGSAASGAVRRPRRELAPLATEADRDRALATLRSAYTAGRLSEEEYERRVGRAVAARTRAEVAATRLGHVTAELPERGARVARRVHRTLLGLHAATFTGANGAAIGVWAATGEGTFWPALLLVPTTGLLAAHAATGQLVRRAWRRRRGGP